MKMKLHYLSAVLFIFSALFHACELKDTAEGLTNLEKLDEAVPVVEESASIMIKVGDVFENVNNLVENTDLKVAISDSEPEITRDGNTFTLDFTNVLGYSGEIVVEFSGDPLFETVNLSATVYCNSFVDNGLTINGIMQFSLIDFNLNGTDEYELKSIGNIDISEDSLTDSINFDFQITHDKTMSSDIVFLFGGSLTLFKEENTHETEIVEDLYKGMNCDYPKFGVVNTILYQDTDDEFTIAIDYCYNMEDESKSECDTYVKLSVGGVSSIISIY